MKKIFLTANLLFSMNVFALGGDRVGNGGDVFVCEGQNPQVMMVDLFEAQMSGRKMLLGDPQLSYKENLKNILESWRARSPYRVAQYLEWLESFESEARFIDNNLVNVSDEGIIILPDHCTIEQAAIQMKDEFMDGNHPRYTINQRLWKMMDGNSRAALVLHELIFREALSFDNAVSLRVRQLNALFFSESTNQEYFEASKKLGAKFVEWGWGGISILKKRDPFEDTSSGYSQLYLTKQEFGIRDGSIDLEKAWIKTAFVQGEFDWHISRHPFFSTLRTEDWTFDSEAFTGKIARDGARGRSLYNRWNFEPQATPYNIYYNQGWMVRLENLDGGKFYIQNFLCTNLADASIAPSADLDIFVLNSRNKNGECRNLKDGVFIKDFSTIKFQVHGGYNVSKIVTFDSHDGKQTNTFKIGNMSLSCNPKKDGANNFFVCSDFPTSLNCEIPKIGGDSSATVSESLTIKDPQNTVYDSNNPNQVKVLLPQGQTVSYKQKFLKKVPTKLEVDTWKELSFDTSGKCTLKN